MKIALWQTPPIHDPQQALTALEQTAQRARTQGADLIVTPEMMLGGYNIGADAITSLAAAAEAHIAAVKTIARTHGIGVVAGLALPGPGGRAFNGVIAVDAEGHERLRYHKTHLFGDVDAAQFAPGTALSDVVDWDGWSVGLAICYDIEFPEVARDLALRGAELILVPTANMIPFDSVPARLVPARAEENALYVAYANYVGAEGAFTYGGLSCICGPDGNDLARGAQQAADLLIADLSKTTLARQRGLQNHLTDRRPDLYQHDTKTGSNND